MVSDVRFGEIDGIDGLLNHASGNTHTMGGGVMWRQKLIKGRVKREE